MSKDSAVAADGKAADYLTSTSRSPFWRSFTIVGETPVNHAGNARRDVFPTRSQTTDGPGRPRRTHSAKSSSLVMMAAPVAVARCQMGLSFP